MPKRDLVLLDAARQVADQINALIDRSPRGRLLHVRQMRESVQSIAANISVCRRPNLAPVRAKAHSVLFFLNHWLKPMASDFSH